MRRRGSSSSDLSGSWILMWALAYLACALLKPDVFEGVPHPYGASAMLAMSAGMLAGLFLVGREDPSRTVGRILLAAAGVLEVAGGVASWTGVIRWNVPFEDRGVFGVSMAVLDLVSAVFLFARVKRGR